MKAPKERFDSFAMNERMPLRSGGCGLILVCMNKRRWAGKVEQKRIHGFA